MIALPQDSKPARASLLEVFVIFLRLGCISFGGPVAHLGYFRTEFVERRQWLNEEAFAEMIAIAQSLPGPASSQTGYMIGILRAGLPGGIAAWLGFTLPSALLMLAFAFGHLLLAGKAGDAFLHGLQLVAVAVIAQAILAMQRSLAPDILRLAFAATAAIIVLFTPASFGTLLAIALGAIAGFALVRSNDGPIQADFPINLSRTTGTCAAIAFSLLLAASLLFHTNRITSLSIFLRFSRTGALVFGGGHVVLPLLENAIVAKGWIGQSAFLSGYGAAQALPGPLFTFAAYLGAAIQPNPHPLLFGLVALLAVFLPGLLLITAVLPFWSAVRSRPSIRTALKGINASVVGVLIAALVRPVWTSTVHTIADCCIVLIALALLTIWKLQPWIVVLGTAAICSLAAILR
jgi:chromate transporter